MRSTRTRGAATTVRNSNSINTQNFLCRRTGDKEARDKGAEDAVDEADNGAANKDDDKARKANGKAAAHVQLFAGGVDLVRQPHADAVEDDGDAVVEDGFAKDDGVQRVVDVHLLKDGEDGDRVHRRDERAKDLGGAGVSAGGKCGVSEARERGWQGGALLLPSCSRWTFPTWLSPPYFLPSSPDAQAKPRSPCCAPTRPSRGDMSMLMALATP